MQVCVSCELWVSFYFVEWSEVEWCNTLQWTSTQTLISHKCTLPNCNISTTAHSTPATAANHFSFFLFLFIISFTRITHLRPHGKLHKMAHSSIFQFPMVYRMFFEQFTRIFFVFFNFFLRKCYLSFSAKNRLHGEWSQICARAINDNTRNLKSETEKKNTTEKLCATSIYAWAK